MDYSKFNQYQKLRVNTVNKSKMSNPILEKSLDEIIGDKKLERSHLSKKRGKAPKVGKPVSI